MALDRPGVMLFGAPRAGKTSIARLVTARMPPHEAMLLPPTHGPARVYAVAANPFFQYNVWDWPGAHAWALPNAAAAAAVAASAAAAPGGGAGGVASSAAAAAAAASDGATVEVFVFSDAADDPLGSMGDGGGLVDDAGVLGSGGSGGGGGGSGGGGDAGVLEALEGEGLLVRSRLREADVLSAASAIVFVVDATEDPYVGGAVEALRRLGAALRAVAAVRAARGLPAAPMPSLEIFLHKVDGGDAVGGGGAEARAELVREVGAALAAELSDAGFALTGAAGGLVGGRGAALGRASSGGGRGDGGGSSGPASSSSTRPGAVAASQEQQSLLPPHGAPLPLPLAVSFHLTSIHDHSVLEAMSRVVQRVAPGPALLPHVEALCNACVGACGVDKVLLMDAATRLAHASDSTPLQGAMYELAAEALDVAADVALIYDPLASLQAAGDAPDPALVARATAAASAPDAGRCSSSLIRLSDGTSLFSMEVAPYLVALIIAKDGRWAEGGVGDGGDGGGDFSGGGTGAGSTGGWGGRGHATSSVGGGGGGGGGWDAGAGGGESGALPRSALSLRHRPLIEHNVRVLARALGELYAHVEDVVAKGAKA
jgi:hypothetical protein